MKFKFDKKLAVDYGVNAVFLLGYLWQKNCELAEAKSAKQHSRRWIRSGHSSIQAELPFLSKHAIKQALSLLTSEGILLWGKMSDCPFDNTSYYAFTQYGKKLMLQEESENE